ncbi:MarR family winged helix-turn-helix transcriptional regulator [Nonlabens ponticola]|uniref:MarR family transcriptional regulator n=1 Tax=Nonlabens ponticola TaxID=2496866 RepID=A0A3S9MZJ9_9FLAO|nr:MarR family transcriptional regulator [Nonlabens ponticola]AZQ44587.1 MarR family transcriptional regulator [Nonlabens ponticola]
MSNKVVDIPLSRKLITTLIKKGAGMTEAIASVLKEEKLTIQQFNVLRILRGRKGEPATLQDVSKNMLHANSNTTRVIDKLVDKKYVERVQCCDDRRQIQLTITKTGLSLLKRLDQKVDDKENALLDNMSLNDKKTLTDLLEKL